MRGMRTSFIKHPRRAAVDTSAEAAVPPRAAERLVELEALRRQGLVPEEEYARKRAKILEDL